MGFGLWFAVFPTSFISFYRWFHKGRVKMPGASIVRLAGVLWIFLVTIVVVFALRRH